MLAKTITSISRSIKHMIVSIFAAGMIVVMLGAQLFGYEDFPTSLLADLPTTTLPNATILAAFVVIVELMALPYVLNMRLSKLMRITSMVFGLIIPIFWLLISFTNAHAANVALFSDTIKIPGGFIPAFWSLLLLALVVTVIKIDSRHRLLLRKVAD